MLEFVVGKHGPSAESVAFHILDDDEDVKRSPDTLLEHLFGVYICVDIGYQVDFIISP